MCRFVIVALALLCPILVGAAESQTATFDITHAWARATPPGMNMGVVYLTLQSPQDDQLLAASTPIAASVEMHESAMTEGVMTMRPLTTVALPRGRTVNFEPAGKHFMLIGLRQPLKAGDSFPFTLKLSKAGTVTVNVNVRKE
jgi:copper(I)-binding protein